MAQKEVVVLCGDKTVRIPADAFNMVINAAGQMRDDWNDYHVNGLGYTKNKANAGLLALAKLEGVHYHLENSAECECLIGIEKNGKKEM